MKIETIKERISKAEEKISKKQNTITKKTALIAKKTAAMEKTTDANEKYWLESDIKWLQDDLKRLAREAKEIEESIEKYKEQLATEEEKAASRNVPAIVEFLKMWQERVFDFYNEGLVPCYEMIAERRRLGKETSIIGERFGYYSPEYKAAEEKCDKIYEEYHQKTQGYFERQKYINRWGEEETRKVKVKNGEWEYLHPYDYRDTYEEGAAKLKSDLKREADRKYDFIIERVNEICGTITDASGLEVGAKGDLNGHIIGERGTANVQTIGAGGWNIQCYHFRTLIHEVK